MRIIVFAIYPLLKLLTFIYAIKMWCKLIVLLTKPIKVK